MVQGVRMFCQFCAWNGDGALLRVCAWSFFIARGVLMSHRCHRILGARGLARLGT